MKTALNDTIKEQTIVLKKSKTDNVTLLSKILNSKGPQPEVGLAYPFGG